MQACIAFVSLAVWQVCSRGRVAPPARSAWLTGGASANGVNFGILYIQIYIQICPFCTYARTKHGHHRQGAMVPCLRGPFKLSVDVR